MHILKNNPFYLKFFTSIEGYLHLFLAPILIYHVSRDIKLSGLFFLMDNLCKFSAYTFSGSLITSDNIKSIIKYSYGLRFVSAIAALIIFFFVKEDRFTLLIVNNLAFTICNAFYITSVETLFQTDALFNKDVQSKLTAGDLWSGGIAVMVVLFFTTVKISFMWIMPIMVITFIAGLTVLHRLVEALNKLKKVELKRIFKYSAQEFTQAISFIRGSRELMDNMLIGYLPIAFFMIVEQSNIFRFSHEYNDHTMKIMHYAFKGIWFLTGAIIVPLVVKRSKEIQQVFKVGVYLFMLGGTLSLLPYTACQILGAILLGYAHNLIFVYRKINRRNILDQSKIGFQSLGVFFAVEGLGGVLANAYLAVVGLNWVALLIVFLFSSWYLWRITRKHTTSGPIPPVDSSSLALEAEKLAE